MSSHASCALSFGKGEERLRRYGTKVLNQDGRVENAILLFLLLGQISVYGCAGDCSAGSRRADRLLSLRDLERRIHRENLDTELLGYR